MINEQKIQNIVSHIDYLISELNHLKSKITIKDGIHFNVMEEPKQFVIEQWDSDLLEPRILTYRTDEISTEDVMKECTKALNTLGIRAFKKQIYWNSDIDWDKLPENFRKLDKVYNINKTELSSILRNEIKGRINALYSVSE
jgi:hypothetical protein